jgi:hypothetical protein
MAIQSMSPYLNARWTKSINYNSYNSLETKLTHAGHIFVTMQLWKTVVLWAQQS